MCAFNSVVLGTVTLLLRGLSSAQLMTSRAHWESYLGERWYLHSFTEVVGTFFGGEAIGFAGLLITGHGNARI